ncbi:MAG TPA: methylated-DNA--[protein]-cysteine S-methyltransferase [Thermoanaerobaculia bacterium]|nr:methylated-DNA--[protein]-cysteine S-methyltransferase [Thermoanaerobaculia bacterium]
MNRKTRESQTPLPAIIRALRSAPREKAPASLLPAVLRRTGLSDVYWRLDSPIGPLFIAHTRGGIAKIARAKSAAAFRREYERERGRPIRPAASHPPAAVRSLIGSLTRGDRAKLRFDLSGLSEFERAVLLKALEIPTGEVRPYSWIAREIGRPEAVRATGSALAKNPVPLLIPCHRVVRSDGHIGQYSLGGARVKRTLLDIEGAEPDTLEKLASSGVRYLGNERERYYCYPTCGGTRSLVLANHVTFASGREAEAAGYHPCETCRPAA